MWHDCRLEDRRHYSMHVEAVCIAVPLCNIELNLHLDACFWLQDCVQRTALLCEVSTIIGVKMKGHQTLTSIAALLMLVTFAKTDNSDGKAEASMTMSPNANIQLWYKSMLSHKLGRRA
jgi:hypothetical protein